MSSGALSMFFAMLAGALFGTLSRVHERELARSARRLHDREQEIDRLNEQLDGALATIHRLQQPPAAS